MTCILPSKMLSDQCSCISCNDLFIPNAQNRHHQKYCKKPHCRKASKRDAQERWLQSSKGSGYFSGHDNVVRVQEWRKANPGYWKRTKTQSTETVIALQDHSDSQVIENRGRPEISQIHALQDLCLLQPALIIGLISTLTGSTLQDDIAKTSRRLIDSGRDILGKLAPLFSTPSKEK